MVFPDLVDLVELAVAVMVEQQVIMAAMPSGTPGGGGGGGATSNVGGVVGGIRRIRVVVVRYKIGSPQQASSKSNLVV